MLTFGIIIPNLNQSQFLHTALMSLRNQSSPFELAIMDGGSSDNFDEVVQPYSDIISYKRSRRDSGQSDAIKKATQKSNADILTWLNADDYYFPGALDKVHSIFENNPEIDVVYGDAIHVNAEGFFLSYFPPIRDFDKTRLSYDCFICQPACFYRRSIYDKVGGIDEFLHYTMDWDLWCRFANHNATFHYLPEPLAAVRYYPDTKTLSGTRERFKEIYRIEQEYGQRIFRRSVLGAYYYGLSHKKNRSFSENLYFKLFDLLRRTKQRMNGHSLLYGFHRWDPIFEKKCQIHLPWYEEKKWTKLHLTLEPHDCTYGISLNRTPLEPVHTHDGKVVADLPDISVPHRIINIECQDPQPCKLLDFRCDLG